ncbi:SirB2 family protein [Mariprofundus ferrooxydans]|uniref:SirB2 family protein n=1 Tax=Mariprofundus ferrooxydans TaxID=314344 RepID=UPI000377125A|nr:SirB2 family protein [Mariprofundus ferrooxydans]
MIIWLLPLHISLVGLSLVLFTWRGVRMWQGRPINGRLLHRYVPDTVDTMLLASGILLAWSLQVMPWHAAWLAAKLIAILLYILLGFVVFRYRGAIWINRACFVIALITVVYIIAVAHTMQPWPW